MTMSNNGSRGGTLEDELGAGETGAFYFDVLVSAARRAGPSKLGSRT